MLLVAMLIGLATALFVYGMTDTTSQALRRDQATAAAFAHAKRALIGWAVTRDPSLHGANARPGELPCPDMNNDGYEDGSCAAGALGRVPWKTLGIAEPKDDAGETLWYAVAGPFRIWNMNGTVINSDTKGDITVYQDSTATVVSAEAVAVIFAPGSTLGAQNRDSVATAFCATTATTIASNLCATNYLETAAGINNATANGPFISALASGTFNDKVMVITTSDLIPPVEQRVARTLRPILQAYKANTACACANLGGTSGCYPWADLSNGYSDSDPYNWGEGRNRGRIPAYGAGPYDWGSNPCGTPVPTLPAWFVNNDWRLVVYYTAGRNFLGPGACTTCVDSTLTVDGVSGKEVVILMPGPNLGASPRAPVALTDLTYWSYYFEDAENEDNGNDWFVTPTSTAYPRDRIYTIP